MARPTLPSHRQVPRPTPQTPAPTPVKAVEAHYFLVQEYDNGWFRAVDTDGKPIIKKGAPGIEWQVTGVSAKRVRERMTTELPTYQEVVREV